MLERIIELVKETTSEAVWWCEEQKTFFSTGFDAIELAEEGWIRVEDGDIKGIVERMIKELPYPITIYRGMDDGIICFETEVTVEELEDAFELEMDGLFIGWD